MVSVRAEVDAAFVVMRGFHRLEPDQVMRTIGGLSARLVEIRVQIYRIEDLNPVWKPLRVREVEPALEELGRQYSIASRLHSVKELEFKMAMGAV